MRVLIVAAALAALGATDAVAQEIQAPIVETAASPAPADVSTPDAVIEALYDVISGDAGATRDWQRFRGLFHPTARLMPTGTDREGSGVLRSLTPEEYMVRSAPMMLAEGFHEHEISRRMQRFGRIAHVWSAYESRHAPSDAMPFMRGVNSIQLFHDGQRWWILNVLWQPETPSSPMPAEYLPPEV